MRNRIKNNQATGQLRWVILLLGVAVVLPTVCLLWFMTQAVKNERLAVRQKLVDVYQEKVDQASQRVNKDWSESFRRLDELITDGNDIKINTALAAETFKAVVYNSQGQRIYPLLWGDIEVPEVDVTFSQAWKYEFEDRNPAEAIKYYDEYSKSEDVYIRFSALLGKARCLAKTNDIEQAEKIYKEIALSKEVNTSSAQIMSLAASGCLRLIELRSKPNQDSVTLLNYNDEYELKLLELIAKKNQAGVFLPLDQRVFIARTVIKDINKWWSQAPSDQKESSVLGLMGNGPGILAMIDKFPTSDQIKDWTIDQPRKLSIDNQQFVAAKHKMGTKAALYFRRGNINAQHFRLRYSIALRHTGISFRIVDGSGEYIGGLKEPTTEAFFWSSIGGYFPDWQIQLYFKDNDIFDSTASKQVSIYIWTGVLVIVLILAAGGFACQTIGRQIKLNRLKNDFIATVSHELKTPLSSMRVLVDTLLEGNYEGEKTATEYLHLISKENERLSRLIDNFLTFSRMERNKKAFDIGRVSPAEIARTAAEAVQTKFNKGKCRLDVSIDEGLPDVSADRDAMVTVLVNLLDNAYKYSYDDKQIELRVFREDSFICFSVKDNGIGMTRRQTKKIFDRFYQADSSLSRQAEGTGLGLAIVKFIVDAHKGQITVESKVNRGSVFKVMLPILADKEKQK